MGLLNRSRVFTFLARRFSEDLKPVMKYLNVAEKNDAAKNIAAILSGGSSARREGLSNYNKIYEFDATVAGQQVRMVMTSVSGHLLNYEFAATYRNWKSCNPVVLFDAPVLKSCSEDYQKIKKTLEREVKYCQGLIIWTDCDREGENIGFEIINVCRSLKPNLRVFRAKFSEITRPSIFRALNNLEQPNQNVSNAVDVRQELDLRTGAAFTRLQTLRLQKVFPQKLADKLISYGSCQFPTLGFVVERYQAIEDFVPEPFWKIKMNHHVKDMTVDFLWKRDRLFDEDACQAILDVCKETPTATVEQVESKPKNKWRPVPLDTVEMEKVISRKMRINAKETMKIAERLYTQGLISYPRTETNIFPKELNLIPLVEQQVNDNRWGQFAQRVMNDGGPNPRQGRKTDQAHPPIHPIKYSNNLNGNEQKVYEYIVRHFLACVSKDALGHETVVHVDIANEKFTAKGLLILERNYLDVYIYETWSGKEIYHYNEGDIFTPTELDMVEGSTSAPKLLTEADLIALMEKNGIGTDATHADHIDTIKSREYVGLHDNIYFVPGSLGMGLVEGYNNMGLDISLAKPTLRAEFESDLKLICDGLKDAEIVRREQVAKYKEAFKQVVERMVQIDQTLASRLEDQPQPVGEETLSNQTEYRPVLKCPKCGNDMVLRTRKNGQGSFISCVGYPSCKNAVWFGTNVESAEVLDRSCQICGSDVKKLKLRFRQNPFPGDPNPNELCIGGCDSMVLESLSILPSTVTNPNNTTTGNTQQTGQTTLNNWFGNNTESTRNTQNTNQTANKRRNGASIVNNVTVSRAITQATQNSSFNTQRINNLLPGPSGNSATFTPVVHRNSSDGNVPDDSIVCTCNHPAIVLTVRKEGPNTGRKFYKCQQGTGNGGCDFFLWDPEDGAPTNANTTNTSGPATLTCNCSQQAALRTVSKEGPNKGRQFYCCPKGMGQGCNFFKWADEIDVNNVSHNGDDDSWGGGGGAGQQRRSGSNTKWKGKAKGTTSKSETRTVPYNTQTKKKRKCGKCGQEGHNRTSCPN